MSLYHVWFATKKRKWLVQGDVQDVVEETISSVSAEEGIDLVKSGMAVDHAHMLVRATDRRDLSRAVNHLKGISSRRVFERLPELKLDIRMNNLWQHRYGVKVIPEKARVSVAQYIRTQSDRLEKYAR